MAVELATSRYQDFRPEWGLAVRTTLGRPRMPLGYAYEEVKLLAPTPRIFKLSGGEFQAAYIDHLDRIGAERLEGVFEDLAERYLAERLVLLCFCDVLGKRAFCHRRIFATWWEEQTGEEVPELDPRDFGGHREASEQTLF